MKKISCLVVVVLGLVGCSSYVSTGEYYYLQSKNGPSLVIPPPLTAANISHFYDLPPQTQDARVSIVPPGLNT